MKQLKSAGLKITAPRVAILNLMQTSQHNHFTADDIFNKLKEQEKNISIATIYRALSTFEEKRILIKMDFEQGQSIYELVDGEHHDHLICLNCNKIQEFLSEEIEQEQKKIAKKNNFELKSHSMVLYGFCNDCKN